MKKKLAFKGNPYFLQNAHYTCETLWCDANNANIVTVDGERILPAGTIWPSNTSGVEATGIVYRDVVIPDGEPGATFSCLTHGLINAHYFPVPVASIVATLPPTIQFMNVGVGSADAAVGYYIISVAAPTQINTGNVTKGTAYHATVTIPDSATSGITFASAVQPGDIVLSNGEYPMTVSAVTVTNTTSIDVTILASKAFHAHLGRQLTLSVRGTALVKNAQPLSFDSNTVLAYEIV